jgi:MFS family permease
MFSGLAAGGRAARTGPVRMSRWALVCSAAGLLIGAAASVPALAPLLLLAPVAIGLAYGLPNPTASMLLGVHAPPDRRGLFFSIKQTGVPIGVGIAGLAVPLLLAWMPWPAALAVLAGASLLLAAVLQAATVLDARPPQPPASAPASSPPAAGTALRALAAPLRHVWRTRALRRLGIASFVFSLTQLCFTTFLVSYLKLEHGLSLAAAAGVLAVSQVLSVAARIFWGQVADRWITPPRLLGLLGLAMGLASGLLALLPEGAAIGLMTASALLCAATTMAWNGVFFAELARRVPGPEIASITGGTQFLTFCGAMTGPVAFATLVGPLGSHGLTYLVLAAAPLAVGLWFLASDD